MAGCQRQPLRIVFRLRGSVNFGSGMKFGESAKSAVAGEVCTAGLAIRRNRILEVVNRCAFRFRRSNSGYKPECSGLEEIFFPRRYGDAIRRRGRSGACRGSRLDGEFHIPYRLVPLNIGSYRLRREIVLARRRRSDQVQAKDS